ncbi:MAG: hypothetical protein HZB80_04350 [Deltaproteobacteria bacterium]|nr:hypothetical protein [Deltaproteobacteria bacterium]
MKKKFDAVDFQRNIREELSKKYIKNRDAFLKELKDKYGLLKKSESARASDNTAQTAKSRI